MVGGAQGLGLDSVTGPSAKLPRLRSSLSCRSTSQTFAELVKRNPCLFQGCGMSAADVGPNRLSFLTPSTPFAFRVEAGTRETSYRPGRGNALDRYPPHTASRAGRRALPNATTSGTRDWIPAAQFRASASLPRSPPMLARRASVPANSQLVAAMPAATARLATRPPAWKLRPESSVPTRRPAALDM